MTKIHVKCPKCKKFNRAYFEEIDWIHCLCDGWIPVSQRAKKEFMVLNPIWNEIAESEQKVLKTKTGPERNELTSYVLGLRKAAELVGEVYGKRK